MSSNPILKSDQLTVAETVLFYGFGAEHPCDSFIVIQNRDKTPERFNLWYLKNHAVRPSNARVRFGHKPLKMRRLQRRNEIHHIPPPLLMLAETAIETRELLLLSPPALTRQVAH